MMEISILNTTIFFNYMVKYNDYTINKNNVSFMVKIFNGTYDVHMNNGSVINVDETTFNALQQ